MAGIALLLPTEQLAEMAQRCVKEEGLEVKLIRHIVTANAISEARQAVAEGASVIIARGYQALIIKKYTNIPVIEIALTGQEIGLIIKKAKKILDIPKPRIALVGFQNMFSNVDYFEELFDVEIRMYYVVTEEFSQAVQCAADDHVDMIIGGNIVNKAAQDVGIPHLFLESTFESIREAIKSAKSAIYAVQVEKRHAAQIAAFQENVPNGILRVNSMGIITSANHVIEEIMQIREADMIGRLLADVVPDIDAGELENVLMGRNEIYSGFIRVKGNAIVFVLTAVKVEEIIDSAILFCYISRRKENLDNERMQKMYLNGFVAKGSFSAVKSSDGCMNECIEQAKLYSLSRNPILIVGETGTEICELAEAIHNNSIRKNFPFIKINLSDMTREQQETVLFGDKAGSRRELEKMGMIAAAQQGTLLMDEIDKLCPSLQHRLFHVIHNLSAESNGLDSVGVVDVRVIASASCDLYQKVLAGEFREDLYYAIGSLFLRIPPLRERPQDLKNLINSYFKEGCSRYNRYHVLTPAARELLAHYSWQGNGLQLEYFMDRLVLSARKRKIEAGYVRSILTALWPVSVQEDGHEYRVIYQDVRAKELMYALEKHHGNREATAKELGISKTTLWRHMKKYGIPEN